MSSSPLLSVEFTNSQDQSGDVCISLLHPGIDVNISPFYSRVCTQELQSKGSEIPNSGLFIVLPKHKCVHARLFSVYRENNMAGLWGFVSPGVLFPKEWTLQHHSFLLSCPLWAHMLVYTYHMHFANRTNDTLHLFKAGFEEHKQWFMGKPAGPSPFHSSLCLGRPRHPQSPRGGVEAAGSMGVGGVRRGRDT